MLPTGKCLVQNGTKQIEILTDKNLNSDAQEYLIDYFRTKVPEEKLEAFIGRK